MKLSSDFFERNTIQVAQELLGSVLFFQGKEVVITETEAYTGSDDPASHACKGKTKRNFLMFEKPGVCYVYLIYGMYFCMNIVTEKDGIPGAVLLRGGKITIPPFTLYDGPGKLCRYLGITVKENGAEFSSDFFFQKRGEPPQFISTPRKGISKGQEMLWRFVVKN
jgi:DNA-3-methyladenine glycosylase